MLLKIYSQESKDIKKNGQKRKVGEAQACHHHFKTSKLVRAFCFFIRESLLRETNGNLAELKEACITLLFIHLHYVLHYPTFYNQCKLSSASPPSIAKIHNKYVLFMKGNSPNNDLSSFNKV